MGVGPGEWGVALGYRPVNRDQPFLLPPDVREWVPADHVVHTLLEVVAQVDTSAFHRLARTGGVGRAGYDPDMMLVVLLLGYCTGQRSSRRIERLCGTDVGFMLACGLDTPDHSSLARFRQGHEQAFAVLFADVLVMCAARGLVQVDTVAIDGTKIAADASLEANRSQAWVRERAGQILAEAAAVDAAEDEVFGAARGDEPDPVMTDPGGRARAVKEWVEQVEQVKGDNAGRRAAQRSAQAVARRGQAADAGQIPTGRRAGTAAERAQQAKHSWQVQHDRQQAKVDAYRQARAAGAAPRGYRPRDPAEHARVRRAKAAYDKAQALAEAEADADGGRDPSVRVNTTDCYSRIMKTRRGWVQGYNVQFAVSADQVILAAQVGQNGNDVNQLEPMMTAAVAVVDGLPGTDETPTPTPRRIGTVLADAGYNSLHNLSVEGPDRLIAQGKARAQARRELVTGPPDPGASPAAKMQHRLDTAAGRLLYKRRGATVEPAIGNFKKLLDRFSRRGLHAAQAETQLAAAAFNIMKIHRAALA